MTLSKVLAMFLLVGLHVGLSILILMYGWNLTPHSWWWIIGGGVFGVVGLRVLYTYVEKEGNGNDP